VTEKAPHSICSSLRANESYVVQNYKIYLTFKEKTKKDIEKMDIHLLSPQITKTSADKMNKHLVIKIIFHNFAPRNKKQPCSAR